MLTIKQCNSAFNITKIFYLLCVSNKRYLNLIHVKLSISQRFSFVFKYCFAFYCSHVDIVFSRLFKILLHVPVNLNSFRYPHHAE